MLRLIIFDFDGTLGDTRANIVMADILSEFWRRYPEISVEIIVDETVAMKERLLKGELDCFLGVNTIHDSTIRFIPVVNESVYLVATEDCLQSHLNIGTSAAAQYIRDNRFDAFNRLPLILHYSISTAHSLILNHIRALSYTPGGYGLLNGEKFKIFVIFRPEIVIFAHHYTVAVG